MWWRIPGQESLVNVIPVYNTVVSKQMSGINAEECQNLSRVHIIPIQIHLPSSSNRHNSKILEEMSLNDIRLSRQIDQFRQFWSV
jgi:hypothetical protein